VADALPAQVGHAHQVTARGAHLMVTVKANQPTLLKQLQTLPWAQVSLGHRTQQRGHGRPETRTLTAVTVDTPSRAGLPARRPSRAHHPHPIRHPYTDPF